MLTLEYSRSGTASPPTFVDSSQPEITVVSETRTDLLNSGTIFLTVKVPDSTPPGSPPLPPVPQPVRLRGIYTIREPDDERGQPRFTNGAADTPPIFIRKMGAGSAPRILSFLPARLLEQTQTAITIRGLNFDASTTLVQLTDNGTRLANIPSSNISVDPATGIFLSTLNFQGFGGPGPRFFAVETAAGLSDKIEVLVVAFPLPQITGLFPNFLAAGSEATIAVAGFNFLGAPMVRPGQFGNASPVLVIPPGTQRQDTSNLSVRLRRVSIGDVPVRVEALGGVSDPLPFFGISSGPNITQVTPAEVVAGSGTASFPRSDSRRKSGARRASARSARGPI